VRLGLRRLMALIGRAVPAMSVHGVGTDLVVDLS